MIVCITGGPRTGKSWLGEHLALTSGTALLRTDDLIPLGWSAASQAAAARLMTAHADLIVEGVAVARALRKALDESRERPCDRLIVLRGRRPEAGDELPGQASMAKGIETVLAGILPELVRRGVEVEERGGAAPVVEHEIALAAAGKLLSPRRWKR